VLVVDGKGDLGSALFGDLMVTQAQAAGLAGLVVDGAVRDTNELIERGYPIFAAGRNPAGPTKGIPGRLSLPICIAGAPVNPGDLVVGDADGVVVIPRNDVEAVLVAAAKKLADEQQRLKEIAEGSLISPWLDDALRAAGVISASESIL
jgi:regulator of RNase E activity RraA